MTIAVEKDRIKGMQDGIEGPEKMMHFLSSFGGRVIN